MHFRSYLDVLGSCGGPECIPHSPSFKVLRGGIICKHKATVQSPVDERVGLLEAVSESTAHTTLDEEKLVPTAQTSMLAMLSAMEVSNGFAEIF